MVLIQGILLKMDYTEEEHILLMIPQNQMDIQKNAANNSKTVIVCLFVK
jgi:hypothetical protein